MTWCPDPAPAPSGRAYARPVPGERDEQRRERLRAAAVELIGNQGYPATTIPGVCAAAKVSTRHFYRLYPAKEDLFVDVYDRLTGESYARVSASLRRTQTARYASDSVRTAGLPRTHARRSASGAHRLR